MNKNLEYTITLLQSNNLDLSIKENKIKVYCEYDNQRIAKISELSKTLLSDFIFNPDPSKGSSIGRLEKFHKDGNVFVFVKSKSGCAGQKAANIGLEYEKQIFETIMKHPQSRHFNIKKGGGSGATDLTINNKLRIEIKSSKDADFGQFTIQYSDTRKTWFINETKKYLHSKDFYDNIFNKYLIQFLNSSAIFNESYSDLRIKTLNNEKIIWGIDVGPNTKNTKQLLEKYWFGGRESQYFTVDFSDVAAYYLNRGDDYIQIQGRGLYAIKQNKFGIPTFSDSCKENAKIRFRIKPHQKGGKHSFMVSVRVHIKPSQFSIENPDILQKIVDDTLTTQQSVL